MKRNFSYVVCILLAVFFMTACNFSGISAEDDIIFLQAAGPFYTSRSKPSGAGEREFLRERTRAVSEIAGRTEDAIAAFEASLTKTLASVQRGRDRIRSRYGHPAADDA